MNAPDLTPIELLHQLVSINSSTQQGVDTLLQFAAEYLNGHGIAVRLVPNAEGSNVLLVASIGPEQAGGVALVAHVDTPRADDREWAFDPLSLIVNDGVAKGLGASSMKAMVSVLLARAPDIALRRHCDPVHIVLATSADFNAQSTPLLLRELKSANVDVDEVILGYPTDMQVALSHKGRHRLVTAVRGSGVHGSHNHNGVNAVWLAAHLIDYIEKIQGEAKHFVSAVESLDPPWTTLNVGRLHGGTDADVVSGSTSFEWEIRTIPELRPDELVSQFKRYSEAIVHELKERSPRVQVETATLSQLPAFRVDVDSSISTSAAQILGTVPVAAVPLTTEAASLQNNGLSVAICGPGSIQYAGTPRESVSIADLARCSNFIFSLLDFLEERREKDSLLTHQMDVRAAAQ